MHSRDCVGALYARGENPEAVIQPGRRRVVVAAGDIRARAMRDGGLSFWVAGPRLMRPRCGWLLLCGAGNRGFWWLGELVGSLEAESGTVVSLEDD